MAQIKLTITIGTYNRPYYIARQVRDVLSQLVEGVSLTVFDNCSDIPVSSLFNEEELTRFTIIRNKVNIGRDQNQVRCLESVNDGWTWTLSDDDKIKPDAIKKAINLISQHQNCCYINTGNKVIARVESFEELTDYFKKMGTLGLAFFQSECLYNMNKLSPYIFWFNDFLSSQIGQICMIMKYMEKNPDEHCFMCNEGLTCETQPGGWELIPFIKNSSILIDKFDYKRKMLKGSLFKSLADTHLTMTAYSNQSKCEKIKILRFIIKRHGIFSIIRYNKITLMGLISNIVIPHTLFSSMKNKIAICYNKRIKTDQSN